MAQEIGYNNSWYTLKDRIGKAEVTNYSYSAFGELLQYDSTGFRFNGEAYDSATGMLNLQARQFEPTLGQFSQRDILPGDASSPLSLNRYTCCVNDPVNFADPSGMVVREIRLPFLPPLISPFKIAGVKSPFTIMRRRRRSSRSNA